MAQQRLRAMMPGPYGNARFVQYGADIVRMNPLHLEREDARRILRPEDADAVEAFQRCPRFADQRAFMGVDRVQPDGLHIVDRRRQADDAGDRSEEHTSELQSLMRISYAVFCFKKKK